MPKRKAMVCTGFLTAAAALVLSVTIFKQNYGAALFIIICACVIIFFAAFENKEVIAEKSVLIAVLCAVSIAGRVLFAGIPSVQPSSFIIIITGIVFGSEMGFMTGALTALVSNMFLGQGPWTPWQMFDWGIMGLVSGIFSRTLKSSLIFRTAYSLLWGFVFGWVMNMWFVTGGYLGGFSVEAVVIAGISSFYMDLAHGVTNAVLVIFASDKFIKMFDRIAVKYGLVKLNEKKV